MRRILLKYTRRALFLLILVGVTFLGLRIYQAESGPPLALWHTYVPKDLTAEEIDRADWARYLAREARLMNDVRREVTQKLRDEERVAFNRYFDGAPIHPARFAQDFNRSFILEPDRAPVGAVVLLHGLTDAPYSQRHIARLYRDRGFLAVVIRMPGHGTVPAGLTEAVWEDWAAATRLAVREARRRVPAPAPLHIVGFSNGGALAMNYALDALGNPRLARADRIVLVSPMIGVTRFARYAGLAGLPSILPAFAKTAWLGIVPEFNPFKYNSFPVNGARQSYRATQILQSQIVRESERLYRLPPVITFQSVMDFTVSTSAIVSGLYAHLPANGSELVLFDVNRSEKFGLLLRPSAETAVERLLPAGARAYRTTVITSREDGVVEQSTEAGQTVAQERALSVAFPPGLFSLSHVALPFPTSDALYGLTPDPREDFGVNLGTLMPRGERNVLIASLDALLRVASNPFFPYVAERITQGIDAPVTTAPVALAAPAPAAVPWWRQFEPFIGWLFAPADDVADEPP